MPQDDRVQDPITTPWYTYRRKIAPSMGLTIKSHIDSVTTATVHCNLLYDDRLEMSECEAI